MGTLMANDAGSAPAEAQTNMVLLLLDGQILAGAAGLPLGLAIFWRARRKLLVRIFAALLGGGPLLVVFGVFVFASNCRAARFRKIRAGKNRPPKRPGR